jgi:hypothetical protein
MSNLKNCSRAKNNGTGTEMTMSLKKTIIYATGLLILFAACGPSMEEFREKSAALSSKISQEYKGLHSDTINGISYNFIRSADMKLQVKNVLSCSNLIENMTKKVGGYLTKSELNTEIISQSTVRSKKDSLLETRMFVTKNCLTIRVPASQFDTTIRQITDLGLFLDYRTQKADDVKTTLYSNSEQKKQYHNFSKKVAKKAEESNQLADVVNAQEAVLAKNMLAEEKEMDSYNLYEQVNYSVIKVELYQPGQISNIMIAALPDVEPYEMPYSAQLGEALMGGLAILKKVLVFLTWCWGVVLPALLIFFLVKRFQNFRGRKQDI